MVKYCFHISDIHIKTYKRHDEYKIVLQEFINQAREFASNYNYDEIRIVITGDVVHQKITISNELMMMVAWFLRECASICPVVMIAGNHDMLCDNQDRMDSLTPIVDLMNNSNVHYLKNSECVVDDNIVWAVYSVFEGNIPPPNIKTIKKEHSDKTIIGLYHGPIIGSKTDLGFEFVDSGVHPDYFEGCDIALLGDIHKPFKMTNSFGCTLNMVGSHMQHNFGESVNNHGYSVLNVAEKTFKDIELPNDYGFYQFKIESLDDIDKENEKLTNI